MKEFRKGQVYFDKYLAGYISETEDGYLFEYHKEFLKKNTLAF